MDRDRVGRVLAWIGGVIMVGMLFVLLWCWMCWLLDRYDTVVGGLMSQGMLNTVGILGWVGFVCGLLIMVVGVFIRD